MLASYRPNLIIIFFLTFAIIASCFSNIHPQRSTLSLRVEMLSGYLAQKSFGDFAKTDRSVALIDSLFLEAMRICGSDKSESLYTLMFTTVQHRTVPLRIPLTSYSLKYPLLSPSSYLFELKNKNIPAFYLFDSKYANSDDRDKLAHFFGSAYLSYNGLGFISLLIGYYIEGFEELFIENNSFDLRDMRINLLGYHFGKQLQKDVFELPSSYIILHNVKHFLLKSG